MYYENCLTKIWRHAVNRVNEFREELRMYYYLRDKFRAKKHMEDCLSELWNELMFDPRELRKRYAEEIQFEVNLERMRRH